MLHFSRSYIVALSELEEKFVSVQKADLRGSTGGHVTLRCQVPRRRCDAEYKVLYFVLL